MTETFTRFDAADYLKSENDVAAYLAEAAAEGIPAATIAALSTVARARNMTRVSQDAGLTREGLYKALSSDGNPSFATVVSIAKALGFQLTLQPMQSDKTASPPA